MGTLCRSSVILNGEARHPYANSAFPYDVLRLHASPSVNYIIAHISQKDNTFCKNFTFLFEHRCEKAYFAENTPFGIVLLWTFLIIFDYLRLFYPAFRVTSPRQLTELCSPTCRHSSAEPFPFGASVAGCCAASRVSVFGSSELVGSAGLASSALLSFDFWTSCGDCRCAASSV